MKKLIWNVVSVVMIILTTCAVAVSCGKETAQAQLAAMIQQENKLMPQKIEGVGTMTAMKYDEDKNNLVYEVTVDESLITIADFRGAKDQVERAMLLYLVGSDDKDVKELMEKVQQAEAGIVFSCTGSQTGEKVNLVVSNKAITETVAKNMDPATMKMETFKTKVEAENQKCPYPVDEGLRMTRVYDDGSNLVYECEVDEDVYDIDALEGSIGDMKEGIAEIFSDPAARGEIEIFAEAGRGVKYLYKGAKSGKSVSIVFTPSELKQYL